MRVWLEVPRQYRLHSRAVWDRDEALYLAGRVVRSMPIQCLVRPGKFSKQAVQVAFGLCPMTEPLQLKSAADETAAR